MVGAVSANSADNTSNANNAALVSPATWDDIPPFQFQLENQRKKLFANAAAAVDAKSDDAKALQHQLTLTESHVFTEQNQKFLQEKSTLVNALLSEKKDAEAASVIQELAGRYRELLKTLSLIDQTFDAEERAEQTRKDSKMYFMMRVRSQLPPKTLKAYGIMELARQQRDQGSFREALTLWAQAETMVRESFNEHIAGMAEWRQENARQADQRQNEIAAEVNALLANYMVDIPGGTFMMGSNDSGLDESPRHSVTLPKFKLGKSEVTFALYDLCVESTQCFAVPSDQNWGRGNRPVTNVSFRDITHQFLPWLQAITGKPFRLPTEAEWEYAARAGSQSEYAWGDHLTCTMARFDGGSTSVCNARESGNRGTAPVMSYKPNQFGLFDMHGNVWEWVEDCWSPNYEGAPTDGSAHLDGNCEIRVMRGGSWDYNKSGLRSANRYYFSQSARRPNYGFRLALDT